MNLTTHVGYVRVIRTLVARLTLLLCAGALPLLAGCSDGIELAVDLQTDLLAGEEFDAIEVDLDGEVTTILAEGSYESRVRVYETELAPGTYPLEIRLLNGGREVVSSSHSVRLEHPLIIFARLTRNCRDVTCPGTGDRPSETECLSGRCVDPECAVLGGDACPESECFRDTDCTSPVACATPVCAEGVCLEFAGSDTCLPGQRCDLDVGCVDTTCSAERAVIYRHYASGLGEHFYANASGDSVPAAYDLPEGAASP